MVKIIFSSHAKLQLLVRKISEREVLEAMSKPVKLTQQPNSRFQVVRVKIRNRKRYLLVVIYDEISGIQEIVTAFYTSKIKKYL